MSSVVSGEQLIEEYRSGKTQRQLAKKYRLSLRDVSAALRSEAGVVVSRKEYEALQLRVKSLEGAADNLRILMFDLWTGLSSSDDSFGLCFRCRTPYELYFDESNKLHLFCNHCNTDELGPI
jgi:hypothetical protein